MELGPADDLFCLRTVADLRGHDAARSGLQRSHERRIIRWRQANEGLDPARTSGTRRVLKLLHTECTMFLVIPECVVAAMQCHDLDHLGRAQLAQTEHLDELVLAQKFLESRGHAVSKIRTGEIRDNPSWRGEARETSMFRCQMPNRDDAGVA